MSPHQLTGRSVPAEQGPTNRRLGFNRRHDRCPPHRVVAVSHECDYPPEVLQKPRVTRSLVASECPSREIDDHVRWLLDEGSPLYEIDQDRLARLNLDLIVTQAQREVCAVNYADVVRLVDARHELHGSTVVALNPAPLEDIFTDVLRLGEAADRLTGQLQVRIEAVREKIARPASRTSNGSSR